MKKILLIVAVFASALTMNSCQDEFLQVPANTGTLDLQAVFQDSVSSSKMLMANYRQTLATGWGGFVTNNYSIGWYHGNISAISGEIVKGQPWHANYVFANTGPSPVQVAGVSMMNPQDAQSIVPFNRIFATIRANYIVLENIDNAKGMTDGSKAIVKAESKALIAYLYMYLFKCYGGVPIVKSTLLATDAPIKRASLKETLDFIIQMSDEAIAGLPNSWPAVNNGRLTKSAAMTLKSEALIIAARPLFNSATPYMDFGSNNNLLCFGNADQNRWQSVIDATKTALAQALVEGKDIINTGKLGITAANPNAVADYGNATSTPNNSELILSCHIDEIQTGGYTNTSYYQTNARYNNQYGVIRNFFTRYLKADGTEQNWPKAGEATARNAAEYVTNFNAMEPRFRLDFMGPGIEDALGNPGLVNWSAKGWSLTLSNRLSTFPNGSTAMGCAMPVKFYYKAGNRLWYEYPIFRAAQLYLQLAEAYNEVGDATSALANLNVVHCRAGLPPVTDTNQKTLRDKIIREWDVEFFDEGKRFFNYREWKVEGIGTGAMYGPVEEFQFQTKATSFNLAASLMTYWSTVTYTAYWNPKMYLEPFPQGEINKGTIIQNPGY